MPTDAEDRCALLRWACHGYVREEQYSEPGLNVESSIPSRALGEHVVQEDGPPVGDGVAPVAAVCSALQLCPTQSPMVGVGPLPAHLEYRQHLHKPQDSRSAKTCLRQLMERRS